MNVITKILFLFILFAFGCSYNSDIDLLVENNTNGNIQVIYSYEGLKDTSNISSGTKLVIVNISGSSNTTESSLKNMKLIPLDILEIRDEDDVLYNKEILDIENWEKIDPEHKGGEGKVLLKLVDNDFE